MNTADKPLENSVDNAEFKSFKVPEAEGWSWDEGGRGGSLWW